MVLPNDIKVLKMKFVFNDCAGVLFIECTNWPLIGFYFSLLIRN